MPTTLAVPAQSQVRHDFVYLSPVLVCVCVCVCVCVDVWIVVFPFVTSFVVNDDG